MRTRTGPRLTWDPTADVAYLYLTETGNGDVLGPTLLVEPDPEFAGSVALDFTVADGRAVGIEFQMASACLPAALLATAKRVENNPLQRLEERVSRRQNARPGRENPRVVH